MFNTVTMLWYIFTKKENIVKKIIFENKWNREQFECDNIRAVQLIDGIEYLQVRKLNTSRQCLIRKDSLEKIKPTEVAR